MTEKECLAIVWGIEKLRPYLEGYQFTELTDHASLRWLHAINNPTEKNARWRMYLQQYNSKGVLNQVADALLRNLLPVDVRNEISSAEDGPNLPQCSWWRHKRKTVENRPELLPDYCIRNG